MLAGAEPSGARRASGSVRLTPGLGRGWAPVCFLRKKCWLHAHTGHYTLLEIRCAARARARLQALLRAGACSGAAQLRASPGGREGAPHLLMLSRRLHRVPAGGTLRMRPGTFLYLDGALRTPGSSGAKGSGGAGGGAAVAAM
jgi:hypothetical protein